MTVSGARSPVVLLLTSPKNTDMQQLMNTHLIGKFIVHEVVWPEIQIDYQSTLLTPLTQF